MIGYTRLVSVESADPDADAILSTQQSLLSLFVSPLVRKLAKHLPEHQKKKNALSAVLFILK